MSDIRRLVLDVLKPHDPDMTELAQEISAMEGVEAVNMALVEIDEEVENIKATIEGEGLDLDKLRESIQDLGGSLHSVDEIVCGSRTIEQVETPQD